MASLPGGTVTFLFTDIEGSTAPLQRLGDRRCAELEEEHRRLLRAALARLGARVESAPMRSLALVSCWRRLIDMSRRNGRRSP